MRPLLVLLALASTVAAPAHSRCVASSWALWPAAGTPLPVNPRLLLEGVGTAAADLEHLARLGPALVATGHRVSLEVKETHLGAFKRAQVVLAPVEPLRPGLHYRLTWKTRPAGFTLPAHWDVGGARDVRSPEWRAAPVALGGEHSEPGCGPSDHVFLEVAVDDDTALLRARVSEGDRTSEYLLPWKAGERLAVGRDMCSGAFELPPGPWSLQLSVVDVAGNEREAPGGPLRFQAVAPVRP